MRTVIYFLIYMAYILLVERIDPDPSMMRTDDYHGRYADERWFGAFSRGFTRHT